MEPGNFKLNETVFYSAQGVYTITGQTVRDFLGEKKPYLELTPVSEHNAKIYVPLDNAVAFGKMQPLLSKQECLNLLQVEGEQECGWILNDSERKTAYSAVLSGTDRGALLHMVRCLNRHRLQQGKKGKKLHLADERFLKNAQRLLVEDLSLVLQVEQEKATALVLGQ